MLYVHVCVPTCPWVLCVRVSVDAVRVSVCVCVSVDAMCVCMSMDAVCVRGWVGTVVCLSLILL